MLEADKRNQWSERLELASSIAWLLMDFSWMQESAVAAVTFAVPAVLGAVLAVPLARRGFAPRAVMASMAAWAGMNACWMLHDLHIFSSLWLARILFGLGVSLLSTAIALDGSEVTLAELARLFRRLRSKR